MHTPDAATTRPERAASIADATAPRVSFNRLVVLTPEQRRAQLERLDRWRAENAPAKVKRRRKARLNRYRFKNDTPLAPRPGTPKPRGRRRH